MNNNFINIEFNGQFFYIKILYSKNKNIYFKIKDNNFILITPKHVEKKILENFALKGVKKFYTKFINHEVNKLYSLENKYFILFGNKYNFDIKQNKNDYLMKIKDLKTVKLKSDDDNSILIKIKFLLKFYLDLYIKKTQKNFEKEMNIPEHSISIRYKATNWASNSIKKRSISYNSKLAHFETQIIDYVIVHELAHHLHPNHSQKFWYLVEQYIPNWKQIRNYLNNNKVNLD